MGYSIASSVVSSSEIDSRLVSCDKLSCHAWRGTSVQLMHRNVKIMEGLLGFIMFDAYPHDRCGKSGLTPGPEVKAPKAALSSVSWSSPGQGRDRKQAAGTKTEATLGLRGGICISALNSKVAMRPPLPMAAGKGSCLECHVGPDADTNHRRAVTAPSNCVQVDSRQGKVHANRW